MPVHYNPKYNHKPAPEPLRANPAVLPVLSCTYRDREIGRTSCRPCGGRTDQGIFECALFGECTINPSQHVISDDLRQPPHEVYNRGLTVLQDCLGCGWRTSQRKDLVNVSVVVISHNYGHLLEEAVTSIRGQTVQVREVIVVDSASTDNTAEVAAGLKSRDAYPIYKAIPNPQKHVWHARRLGYEASSTQSEWIIFLDADDSLPQNYVEACLNVASQHPQDCAVVYTDLQEFGASSGRLKFQDSHDLYDLCRNNYIHAGAMVRREALQVTGAFDYSGPLPIMRTADWFLWLRVLRNGWSAYKAPPAYLYRQHEVQMSRDKSGTYYEKAHLSQAPLTIVVPLSGRESGQDVLRWLQTQPRTENTSILILNDSGVPVASGSLQGRYSEVRVVNVPESPADPDEPRGSFEQGREIDARMCQIYGLIYDRVHTPYLMIVEDDIRPPQDAVDMLLRGMEQWADSITGVYQNRHHPDEGLVMLPSGKPAMPDYEPIFEIEPCLSSGFGCVLFRTECFDRPFRTSPIGGWYDLRFFEEGQLQHMVHWGVRCGHAHIKAPWEENSENVSESDLTVSAQGL